MKFKTILVEQKGSILTITMNRPKLLNAMTFQMSEELRTVFETAKFSEKIRALVLTGNGSGFCSGADLARRKSSKYDPSTPFGMKDSLEEYYHRTMLTMGNLEKPIIGAINGVAAGAGISFALACDIIIASEKASFIEIFVKRGMVPDCASSFFLARHVGLARAKEIMFTGERVYAEEALRIGMVNRVVPPDQLMKEARAWALKLSKLPTKAIGLIKQQLHHAFQSSLEEVLREEAFGQSMSMATEDSIEGVLSFIQKRPPKFKGR